jgi:hypothetical protein
VLMKLALMLITGNRLLSASRGPAGASHAYSDKYSTRTGLQRSRCSRG